MFDDQIRVLRGPDRIRKRPAVIFLSDGIRGVEKAVGDLLELLVKEARLGNIHSLEVSQQEDVIRVQAQGHGLYLGHDTGDDRVWRALFCDLVPLPATPPEGGFHFRLFGPEVDAFEVGALQCACRFMEVTAVRDGVRCSLRFEKGHPVGGLEVQPCREADGTCIRFAPDGEVFTQTRLSEAFFQNRLGEYAQKLPQVRFRYEKIG